LPARHVAKDVSSTPDGSVRAISNPLRHPMTAPIRKAVFPVAGLGTRFLPATKVMPKEMLVVVDKPLIQWAVEEAAAAGCTLFILVTSRGKSLQVDHFDHHEELVQALSARGKKQELAAVETILPSGTRVATTRQPRALGLGHAVACARDLVGDEPFAVLLPDDMVLADTPCLVQMVQAYRAVGGNLVGVMDVPREEVRRYGILDIDQSAPASSELVRIKGLVEKPEPDRAPSTLSIIGRYILQPDIFTALDQLGGGAGGEIQLTDGLARLIGRSPLHGFRFRGTRYDCGDKAGYIAANLAFALERADLRSAVREQAMRVLAASR
jgi:UTP--glucose-1-phosphate uridylyltransferase